MEASHPAQGSTRSEAALWLARYQKETKRDVEPCRVAAGNGANHGAQTQ
jgi:hypothetical protein